MDNISSIKRQSTTMANRKRKIISYKRQNDKAENENGRPYCCLCEALETRKHMFDE